MSKTKKVIIGVGDNAVSVVDGPKRVEGFETLAKSFRFRRLVQKEDMVNVHEEVISVLAQYSMGSWDFMIAVPENFTLEVKDDDEWRQVKERK